MAKKRKNPIIFKLQRWFNRWKGRLKRKKGKYEVKKKSDSQLSKMDESEKVQQKNENKLYWIRAITGVITAIFGTAVFNLVGWGMFIFFIIFLLAFPFFISFIIMKVPYEKGKWDWKMIMKKGLSPHFFLFMLVTTIVHTHMVNEDFAILWDNPADTHDLIVSNDGKTIYIADGNNGLMVLDITNPIHREYLGKHEIDGSYKYIARINDNVFVINNQEGLMTFDVSDPSEPELISTKFPNLKDAKDIEAVGNNLYVSNGEDGLIIINATNVNNLKIISSFNTDGSVENVFVNEELNLTYIADGEKGLKILNITNIESPSLLDSFIWGKSTSEVLDVAVKDNTTAYLAHSRQGLVVLDVTNPADISFIRNFSWYDCTPLFYLKEIDEDIEEEDLVERKAQEILIHDHRVFIAAGSLGIVSYNITNNSIAIYYDTKGIAQSMCIEGDTMFVADGYQAIVTLDITLSWRDSIVLSPPPLQTGQKKIPFGWHYLIFAFVTILKLIGSVKRRSLEKIKL
jgi:hypothetical protein